MNENRPTSSDLIEAVCGFLEDKVMPNVDAYTAFHARVAVNTLGIVRREIEMGGVMDAGEHERLVRLLKQEGGLSELNALLCQKIRDGQIDCTDPGLIEHLRKTVMGKLSIDNPDYSAYKQAIEKEGEP